MSRDRDGSRDALDVLAGARRAFEPSHEDAARVLHNARLAIASGAAVTCGASAAPHAGALRVALIKKVAAALVIAGASAFMGYRAGYVIGARDAERVARAQHVAPRSAPAVAPAAARVAAAVEQATPPIAAQPALESSATLDGVAAPRRRAKASAAPEEVAVVETPASAATPAANPSLDAEVRALRRVEQALRNREPERALAVLAQLDRDVPEGQMAEERAAASAMARCDARAASGRPDQAEAMQRVLEFSQRFPASVYFARVRQSCLATISADATTDSAPR